MAEHWHMSPLKKCDACFEVEALNAEQREFAIARLRRRVKRFNIYATVAVLIALLLGWDGRFFGALAAVILAALFFAEAAKLRADLRLLLVLDSLKAKP
jgi:hypothetical protein